MTTRKKSSGDKSNFIAQRKEGMVMPEDGLSEEVKSAWVQLVPALSVQVAGVCTKQIHDELFTRTHPVLEPDLLD